MSREVSQHGHLAAIVSCHLALQSSNHKCVDDVYKREKYEKREKQKQKKNQLRSHMNSLILFITTGIMRIVRSV